MKRFVFVIVAAVGLFALNPPAQAVTCANGVYRAGCVGPNGAAVARKYSAPPAAVHCGSGAHRAGCVGPNGAVVRRRY